MISKSHFVEECDSFSVLGQKYHLDPSRTRHSINLVSSLVRCPARWRRLTGDQIVPVSTPLLHRAMLLPTWPCHNTEQCPSVTVSHVLLQSTKHGQLNVSLDIAIAGLAMDTPHQQCGGHRTQCMQSSDKYLHFMELL